MKKIMVEEFQELLQGRKIIKKIIKFLVLLMVKSIERVIKKIFQILDLRILNLIFKICK